MSDHETRRRFLLGTGTVAAAALAGCTGSDDDGGDNESMDDEEPMNGGGGGGGGNGMNGGMEPTDPASAPRAEIDRFSQEAGTLLVRTEENGLPGPDEAVDFDQAPFLTQGLGPDGEVVEYYNFDVQPTAPAPIYAFFYENGDPVEGQLNIVDVIPGDDGYNDFWRVNMVTVPDDYEANTVTSVAGISEMGYDISQTNVIKNCPIVPEGSTASKHFGDDHDEAPVVQGWYDGQVVEYFLFEEDSYETMNGSVPLSPIYVSFNVNPGQEGGGPASGFYTEGATAQTHNVVATLPGDAGYSPLWMVNVYDNADFGDVSDLDSATNANILAEGAAMVNCPIVSLDEDGLGETTTFTVRIENVASPDFYGADASTGGAIWVTPGGFGVHTGENPIYTAGEPASIGLEALAEAGPPTGFEGEPGLVDELQAAPEVVQAGAYTPADTVADPNDPTGEVPGAPPIAPGGAFEFDIEARPGQRLSFASMFVPSNDAFFSPGEQGVPLWSEDGEPVEGDVTDAVTLLDAGTEPNSEPPGFGPDQAPAQDAPTQGADEDGVVRPLDEVDDGHDYPAVEDAIQVTLTPQ